MISHKHKFIWTPIPRTGTTSLGHSLMSLILGKEKADKIMINPRGVNLPADEYQTILQAKSLVSEEQFKEYFKFAIVRNPWARFVSMYSWAIETRNRGKVSFRDWTLGYEKAADKKIYHPIKIFREQEIRWVGDDKNKVLVDYVGKFESLAESWQHIAETIGVKMNPVRFKESKTHRSYMSYYDKDTKAVVDKLFAEDIKLFNYKYGE